MQQSQSYVRSTVTVYLASFQATLPILFFSFPKNLSPMTTTMTTTTTELHFAAEAAAAVSSATTSQNNNTTIQHRTVSSVERGSYSDGRLSDPFLLCSGRKSEEDIKQQGASKKVQMFYRKQNDQIDNMLGPLQPLEIEETERRTLKVYIALFFMISEPD